MRWVYKESKLVGSETVHKLEARMSATQLKMGVRAWHEELLEFIIANPRASGAETALYFNVTESWLSIVKNSDAFRELWAKRRPEHFSRVSAGVSEKLTALAEVTLDALTDVVEKEKREGNATVASLRETAEMTLKAMGFGNKSHNTPVHVGDINVHQQNNIIQVDRDTLARAREAKARMAETLSLSDYSGTHRDANTQAIEGTLVESIEKQEKNKD